MKLDYSKAYTLWVCTNCLHHHANGECGGCHEEKHEGGEPLSLLMPGNSAMGLPLEDHRCDDPENVNYECDCEVDSFSTASCEGCGSDFHGERHAMTEWEVVEE